MKIGVWQTAQSSPQSTAPLYRLDLNFPCFPRRLDAAAVAPWTTKLPNTPTTPISGAKPRPR